MLEKATHEFDARHFPSLHRLSSRRRVLERHRLVGAFENAIAMLPQTVGDCRHDGGELRTISPAPRRRFPPAVDVQIQSFLQSQAEGVHRPEKHGHALRPAAVNDLMDLLDGQQFRQ